MPLNNSSVSKVELAEFWRERNGGDPVWIDRFTVHNLSFAIAFLATAGMRWLAPRFGLIDRPAARKVHRTPTPLGGGLGIWLGVVAPLSMAQLFVFLLARNSDWAALLPTVIQVDWQEVLARSPQLWAILCAGTLLSAMGLTDDYCGEGPAFPNGPQTVGGYWSSAFPTLPG